MVLLCNEIPGDAMPLTLPVGAFQGHEHSTLVADQWFYPTADAIQRRCEGGHAPHQARLHEPGETPYDQMTQVAGKARLEGGCHRPWVALWQDIEIRHLAVPQPTSPERCWKVMPSKATPPVLCNP